MRLITLVLIVSCLSCNKETRSNINDCADKLTLTDGKSPDGIQFRNQLRDTLKVWTRSVDIWFMESYKNDNYQISKRVLFNEVRDKAMGFIIKQRNSGEYNDVVQVITAEKVSEIWHYYILGNWTLTFTKCDSCPEVTDSLTTPEIEKRLVKNLLDLKFLSPQCKVNDEGWVTDFKRIDHRHRFLSGTYPKYDSAFHRLKIELPTK